MQQPQNVPQKIVKENEPGISLHALASQALWNNLTKTNDAKALPQPIKCGSEQFIELQNRCPPFRMLSRGVIQGH